VSTSTDLDVRAQWRAIRVPVSALAVLVLVSLVLAVVASRQRGGLLDPGAYDPQGSRALAQLLTAEGVAVRRVTTLAEVQAIRGEQATLLVARPELVPPDRLAALRGAARELVLVAPRPQVLRVLAPAVSFKGTAEVRDRAPGCELPLAVAAGDADLGGSMYTAADSAALCYTDGGRAALVRVGAAQTVTVLGAPAPLTNERLDENGNAALALRLLGQQPQLLWYLPSLSDPALGGGSRSLTDLLPSSVKLAVVQIGVAVVLLALWRARRLGPVVAEPLPVVVRASETVEGRARLYRRARARDRAADALRTAARARLVARLGLARDADPPAVADAVARRTGRSPAQVAAVLYGAPPDDPLDNDAALVRLAETLDALEEEVRRS
jgi:hypothetical protein